MGTAHPMPELLPQRSLTIPVTYGDHTVLLVQHRSAGMPWMQEAAQRLAPSAPGCGLLRVYSAPRDLGIGYIFQELGWWFSHIHADRQILEVQPERIADDHNRGVSMQA